MNIVYEFSVVEVTAGFLFANLFDAIQNDPAAANRAIHQPQPGGRFAPIDAALLRGVEVFECQVASEALVDLLDQARVDASLVASVALAGLGAAGSGPGLRLVVRAEGEGGEVVGNGTRRERDVVVELGCPGLAEGLGVIDRAEERTAIVQLPALREAESCPELVLERFYRSLELCIRSESSGEAWVMCASGAVSPLRSPEHPVVDRCGLDFVALRQGGPSTVVLGVTETPEERTPFILLMRLLNCFEELAPPFQIIRLAGELIEERLSPNTSFDLQLSVGSCQPAGSQALHQFSRDLADVFKHGIQQQDQFEGTLGWIECLSAPDPE